jgi:antitoxin ParD1/3/4
MKARRGQVVMRLRRPGRGTFSTGRAGSRSRPRSPQRTTEGRPASSQHRQYDILILMSTIERITITLTAEMAQAVRGAVQAGEYASSSEIIREALRDWRHKRALQEQELGELRAQVQEGLADIAAGRVRDFDAERIIRKGKEQLAVCDACA